jgi:hypothetical protein
MDDMTSMTVITKSYAPDFELCADLARSVLRWSDTVQHQIIVPGSDMELFGQLAGPRTTIRPEADLLPRSFVRSPVGNVTINARRPWPPVRGWIVQQLVKLAVAAESTDDIVVIVDSDTEFVRPFDAATFAIDGAARFYRLPDGVDEKLPRHMIWHQVARKLLGRPEPATPPLPDYIASLVAWDPAMVRRMLDRVEQATGSRWVDVVAGQLHFSECILYGVFAEQQPAQLTRASDRSLCHAYWGSEPLDDESAEKFFSQLPEDDVAIMVSAKSYTPLAVRRAAFTTLALKNS